MSLRAAGRASRIDREARFPRESVEDLADGGALGLAVPERVGGAGAGPVEIVEAIERVAGACASTGMVCVMQVVAMQTLAAGIGEGEPGGPKHVALAAAVRGRAPLDAGLLRARLARALLGAGLARAGTRRRRGDRWVILALVPAGRVWGLDARLVHRGSRRFDHWPF